MGRASRPVMTAFGLTLLFLTGQAFAMEYYVSGAGDDANPGTSVRPFATIQRAADVMGPGDTCYVRRGTYRETVRLRRSGREGKPIRFAAAPGERVVLDGTEPISGKWELWRGHIYRVRTPEPFEQLFVDRRMMIEARWPNARFDQMLDRSRWAKAGKGSRYGKIVCPELAGTRVDWTGALAHLNIAHQWWSWTRTVTAYQRGSDTFTYPTNCQGALVEESYRNPTGWRARLWEDDYFYLSGKLEALDSPTEWFRDDETGELYLWPDDGKDPTGRRIEYKKRTYAFDVANADYVELRGFDFFATSFRFTNCNHCVVEDCRLMFPTYSRRIVDRDPVRRPLPATAMRGDYNVVRCVRLAYANQAGIMLWGQYNTIEDCLVHDTNWDGVLGHGAVVARPPWNVKDGHGSIIRRNTLYNCGNAIIEFNGRDSVVEYNHVYNGGLACKDVALIYTGYTSCAGSVIRYNWVHGCRTDRWLGRGGLGGIGIRGDDHTRNLTVHHNVVWDCGEKGIVVKGDGNRVYNNTVLDIGAGGEPGKYIVLLAGPERARKGPNPLAKQNLHTFAHNNVARTITGGGKDSPVPAPKNVGNNYRGDSPRLVAADKLDFRPAPGSPLIDAGRTIPGITDGFAGAAPDIGAYEFGGETWKPGPRPTNRTASLSTRKQGGRER